MPPNPDDNQPMGRMTVLSLPEHLRGPWEQPQEVEIRLCGELVVFGLATATRMSRFTERCANPSCEGYCKPSEYLRVEIDIAPFESQEAP